MQKLKRAEIIKNLTAQLQRAFAKAGLGGWRDCEAVSDEIDALESEIAFAKTATAEELEKNYPKGG